MKQPSRGDVRVRIGGPGEEGVPEADRPFRVLVIGDFGGSARPPLAARRPVAVDRDELDAALSRFAPELTLRDPSGREIHLRFAEMDDFHPDAIGARVSRVADLVGDVRRREEAPRKVPAGSALLDAILSGQAQEPSPDETEKPEEEIGAILRGILHAPSFRALESAWRGVDLLLRRLDTDGPLRLFLLDAAREEIDADLLETDDPARSALFKVLVEETVGTRGGEPYTLVAVLSPYAATAHDAEALGMLAQVAGAAGGAVVAGGDPLLLGCRSLVETPDPDDWTTPLAGPDGDAWKALRRQPEARRIALGLPRLLLRLPYGKETDPAESFPFEELDGPVATEEFLWGSPALALAVTLGQAFLEDGWAMSSATPHELEDLPFVVLRDGPVSRAVPCSEAGITVRASQRMLESGITPLLWMKDSDHVRVPGVVSYAEPSAPLEGRWKPR